MSSIKEDMDNLSELQIHVLEMILGNPECANDIIDAYMYVECREALRIAFKMPRY